MKINTLNLSLIKDENSISVSELSNKPHSTRLDIYDTLPFLVSPDTRKKFKLINNCEYLSDDEYNYPIKNGCPILYPRLVQDAWTNGQLPNDKPFNSILQYFYLSQIKQVGEINAPLNSKPYEKHLHRFNQFCRELKGVTIDIGCDSPKISATFFPEKVNYIGIDPFAENQEFRIIGVSEFLPFKNQSIDNVIFNTSLDHILDYHLAIDEAYRVLKPEGKIIIATYAWLNDASLLFDSVHFHHFRESEIIGCLNLFTKIEIKRYESPKGDRHRYGLYIYAVKSNTNEFSI